jgi:hypothetical protein
MPTIRSLKAYLVAGTFVVLAPSTGLADPPLPGCLAHLLDKAPTCGGRGPDGVASDGCCPSDCSASNDPDCCTNNDGVCLDPYGCNRQNDTDCCVNNDHACRTDLGCDATVDSDCKPAAKAETTKSGCSAAGAALPPLLGVGLLLGLGVASRLRRRRS